MAEDLAISGRLRAPRQASYSARLHAKVLKSLSRAVTFSPKWTSLWRHRIPTATVTLKRYRDLPTMEPSPSVAVIGLGALGLVTLKNLLEEGFDAKGFERNSFVGGLWKYIDGPQTSVLKCTIANISKQRGCFTDFPFKDDVNTFPRAEDIQQYLVDYADHFALKPNIRLKVYVSQVRRKEELKKWEITASYDGAEPTTELFDKVVFATGINATPATPETKDIDKFEGTVVHSQAYKRPEDFEGKTVVVVGLSNSGADTATTLVGHAKNVYISRKRGAYIVPRYPEGKAIDHGVTHRMMSILNIVKAYLPSFAEKMIHKALLDMQNKAFDIDPNWNICSPTAPAALPSLIPIISDELVPQLRAGTIRMINPIQSVLSKHTLQLTDGTTIQADTCIFCTGYMPSYDILEPANNPISATRTAQTASPGFRNRPFARLYRNIFSLEHPDSLAFIGAVAFMAPAFQTYDLASMALTQVWKGNTALPDALAMTREVDARLAWVSKIASTMSITPLWVDGGEWMQWANDAAGTGVNEKLGYGWEGWRFWYSERTWCNALMDGITSPHMYRLFKTGKRREWSDARREIERIQGSPKS